MSSVNEMLPFAPFILGIGAIFISSGSVAYMVAGDALVLLAGIAFIKAIEVSGRQMPQYFYNITNFLPISDPDAQAANITPPDIQGPA